MDTTIRRLIPLILIVLLVLPSASAYIYTEEEDGNLKVPVGGNYFITATLENSTKLNQEGIKDANFTTANHTFPYKAAYKITYQNDKGQIDYLITWRCDVSNYFHDYAFSDLTQFYSGYLNDNKTPVYLEVYNDNVYGIILDTQNITYTEANLVHDILGRNYALSDEVYDEPTHSSPQMHYSDGRQHYEGVDIDPYELVESDPWAYYDYFDYEDNVDIDEYLYDEGYDE